MCRASAILFCSLVGGWARSAAADHCLVLRQDAVTAADVAEAEPAFGGLPPATRIAWAPAPGLTRTLAPGELTRLGRAHGLAVSPRELCWQREVKTIRPEDIQSALARAGTGMEVTLLAFGPRQAPEGRAEFSRTAIPRLPRPATGPVSRAPVSQAPGVLPAVLWRGRLVTAGGNAFPLWARVRLAQRRSLVVARRQLAAGELIQQQDLERVERSEYPGWDAPLGEPALAVGRRVRRTIPVRATVLAHLLTERREVERGDTVVVELSAQEPAGDGATQATLTTQAESPGKIGATILLKNPLTGRRFPSRVTGVGRAVMMPANPAPANPATGRQNQEVSDARP